MRAFAGFMAACAIFLAPIAARADDPIVLKVVDGAIPEPLTSQPGNPAVGRIVMVTGKLGNCVACHKVPALKAIDFQGEIAPSLDGVAQRYTAAQLRLIVSNAKLKFPGTVMPAFHRNVGLKRVAPEYDGKPILTSQQVEDVVAFLQTLN
ncbi:MAG: sulfur oxidation c-type cytochrome SoxX [Roseiarcus sp.]